MDLLRLSLTISSSSPVFCQAPNPQLAALGMRHSSSSRVKMLMAFAWIKSMMPCGRRRMGWGLGMDWWGRTLGGKTTGVFYMFFFTDFLNYEDSKFAEIVCSSSSTGEKKRWISTKVCLGLSTEYGRNQQCMTSRIYHGFEQSNKREWISQGCYQKQDRSTIDPSSISISTYICVCTYWSIYRIY